MTQRILERARAIDKPFTVLFLGADLSAAALPPHIVPVKTLYQAAAQAVAACRGSNAAAADAAAADAAIARAARDEAKRLAPGQRFLRALYSGGTFCTEAQVLWRERGLAVASNVPIDKTGTASANGGGHVALDLGSDEFTVGRPHPMIDPAPGWRASPKRPATHLPP